nr:hypothetical protein BaRGS_018036 [Batillaria attramentaria]
MPEGSLEDIQNTDFAISFLQNRSEDQKPFFLGLGFHKPHLPFKYPKEYLTQRVLGLYPMSKIKLAPDPFFPPWLPDVAYSPWGELRSYDDIQMLNLTWPFQPVPVEYQLKLRQSYSAAASYTDAQVGRILQALDQYGFANNTIITFNGDHGRFLHGRSESCTCYQEPDRPVPDPSLQWKPAVFSQYPRPNATIQKNSGGPHLAEIRVMGYTMKTADHRYTEWVAYDPMTFTANMSHVYARELYNHLTDLEENLNVVDQTGLQRRGGQTGTGTEGGVETGSCPECELSLPSPALSSPIM